LIVVLTKCIKWKMRNYETNLFFKHN
jgi:hypothetical protein